jgi:IS6 family transposase
VAETDLFKWRHYESEIILLCVRWYLRYSLSYRDLEEMMRERGLSLDHTTIYRWVQAYAPELEKRIRPHLRPTNDSYRVDVKEEGILPDRTQLRQCNYLNNLIEQDHRFIKRRVNPGLGFFSFKTAWRTIRGYETKNLIRKGQIAGIGRGEIQMQVKFVSNFFGIAA